jgi:hypothetical protein
MTKENVKQNSAQSANRRKLLKGLGGVGGAIFAGGALPEKWAKPVVQSVMLPAHAESTTRQLLILGGGGGGAGGVASLLERTFELVTPRANAVISCPNNIDFNGCISFTFAHDGAGHVVGGVTLVLLAVPCPNKIGIPNGPSAPEAQNVSMSGGPINWSASTSGFRDYGIQLAITNASAASGQKFGRVALQRNDPNNCSAPQFYNEFDVFVDVLCSAETSTCED